MKITYNETIEVTSTQFQVFKKYFDGICAFQQKNNKFFIRCWHMKYKKEVGKILETVK